METIETLVYFFLNFVYARKRIQASKGYLSGVAALNQYSFLAIYQKKKNSFLAESLN